MTNDPQPNSRGTKAIILIAMALAVFTAVGGFIAVYRQVFVYGVE